MAKILNLPALSIIKGFKGTLDFYVHMGQACVRRWPRSPGHRRAPAVEAQWSTFTLASRAWSSMSPAVQQAWRNTASGTGMTGYELSVKGIISGYIEHPAE